MAVSQAAKDETLKHGPFSTKPKVAAVWLLSEKKRLLAR